MSPEYLCRKGTESGEQKALFAWANMARLRGFDQAFDMAMYGVKQTPLPAPVVPELEWLFAIPNGGLRDPKTAAMMKAEGVRPGVSDVLLPVKRGKYSGLFVELKKKVGGRASDAQNDFAVFVLGQGFGFYLAHGWYEAATVIRNYLEST